MSTKIKKTALYELHEKAGGRIVEFAGWLMPIQFSSIIDEHLAVRNAVGLFDVSHMGEIEFKGPDALKAIQNLICNDASTLIDGQVLYSGLMTEQGTFVDDVLVYRLGPDHYLFCVNASNTDKDYAWITQHIAGNLTCENISDTICQIAIQGPKALTVLGPLVDVTLKQVKYYHAVTTKIAGHEVLLSRTGYTGERGYELYLPNQYGPEIWTLLMKAGADYGIKPIGLGARDTLRLEASMPLYGNDIDDTTTPFDASLDWIVKLEKGDFIGRTALVKQQEQGATRKLVGLELVERGIPRHGYAISKDGVKVGVVTSGTHAPYLKKPIGMGYVPPSLVRPGTRFEVEIRGKLVGAEVVEMPFYSKRTKGGN